MSDAATEVTALYRMYGHDGVLLYVGITCDIGSRFKTHSKEKPWWQQVSRVDVATHLTREDALAAERAEIRTSRPAWNIVHNRIKEEKVKRPKRWPNKLRRKWWLDRDEDILALCLAGWDMLDIETGLSISNTSVHSAMWRLLPSGRLLKPPPRRHPGSGYERDVEAIKKRVVEVLGFSPIYGTDDRYLIS